jgi:adenosylcobinamide-GDP ribazoletransferase
MRALLVGLQFLTRLPVRVEVPTAREITNSYHFYPVIGLLLGLAAAVVYRGSCMMFPGSFSIVVMLAFLVWITGALHEDGLADVADAIGGGWTRDQRLDIMKDSRIGAFGAVAVALVLLGKYSALSSMPVGAGGNGLGRSEAAVVIAQMLGRYAFLLVGYWNRPAREGLGSEFMKGLRPVHLITGSLMSAGAAVLLAGSRGALALICAAAVVVIASIYFRRKLGGVTGDCLGATFQFVEVMTYAVFLA